MILRSVVRVHGQQSQFGVSVSTLLISYSIELDGSDVQNSGRKAASASSSIYTFPEAAAEQVSHCSPLDN